MVVLKVFRKLCRQSLFKYSKDLLSRASFLQKHYNLFSQECGERREITMELEKQNLINDAELQGTTNNSSTEGTVQKPDQTESGEPYSSRIDEELWKQRHQVPPEILYKSKNYLAVNKRYDIKINSDDPEEVTVETECRKLHPELVDNKVVHGFRFVHRLDYATSGVLCMALNKKSAARLHEAFKIRQVTKHYMALVRNHVKQSPLLIDEPIGSDTGADWDGRMCVSGNPFCGDRIWWARTLMICLAKGTYDNQPASKVLLIPFTGRTHQLRVHCSHVGHTIIGDYTYSNREDTDPYRMMLHACRLIAPNMKEETIDVEAPDPFTSEMDSKWQPYHPYTDYKGGLDLLKDFNKDNILTDLKDLEFLHESFTDRLSEYSLFLHGKS